MKSKYINYQRKNGGESAWVSPCINNTMHASYTRYLGTTIYKIILLQMRKEFKKKKHVLIFLSIENIVVVCILL